MNRNNSHPHTSKRSGGWPLGCGLFGAIVGGIGGYFLAFVICAMCEDYNGPSIEEISKYILFGGGFCGLLGAYLGWGIWRR